MVAATAPTVRTRLTKNERATCVLRFMLSLNAGDLNAAVVQRVNHLISPRQPYFKHDAKLLPRVAERYPTEATLLIAQFPLTLVDGIGSAPTKISASRKKYQLFYSGTIPGTP